MPTRSGKLSTEEVAERLGLRVETVPARATVSRSVCNAWDHAETR
jgi:hypothetical protein